MVFLCRSAGLMNVLGFSLYASVGALPQPRRYFMVAARFIVGIAAGLCSSIRFCLLRFGFCFVCLFFFSGSTIARLGSLEHVVPFRRA